MHRAPSLRRSLPCLAFTLFATAAVHPLDGQIRGSERAMVRQVADGTTVTIDYARPLVRGRSPVFPDLIEWGHVWTPGANSATTLSVDRAIRLNGVDVPEGSWSVWFIPAEEEWEIVLDPDQRRYHTQPPQPADDQIRMVVTPGRAEHTEVLTWDFPHIDREGMALRFRWDDVLIDFRIDVESTATAEVPEDEGRAIAGRYEMLIPEEMRAQAEAAGMPTSMPFDIRYEDGRLLGSTPMPGGAFADFELFPRAAWVYNPGWMMDGEVYEMELEVFFEFHETDGRVTGFDMRGVVDDRIDRVMMSATRAR